MAELISSSKLTCMNCKGEIGELVSIENIELVRIRGVILRYAHGFCIECGTEFHWSVSDRMLQRMLERLVR
jgi:hypothetical protein